MAFQDILRFFRPDRWGLPVNERRETTRLRCNVGVLLRAGEDHHFAKVVDVHSSGLCVELDSPLKTDSSVTLSRDDFGQPWKAKVLWCHKRPKSIGYRAGVSYPSEPEMMRASWLQPALKQAGFRAEIPGEKRKLVRIPGRVGCQLKGLTGEVYVEGEMLNLSLGGAKVEAPMEFPLGLTVEVETVPLGGLPPLQGIAKIASRQEPDGTDLVWSYGLRFTESKELVVKKYMASMLRG